MSGTEALSADAIAFEGVTPILRVRSLAASIDYYVNVLGFKLDWEASGPSASVSRGRCHLFLCEGDQGNPGTWVWIGVGDCERLFEEYCAKGAKVRHPPTNYPWALEMQVEDPDGNVLRMGSQPKSDRPVGEWLDMRGIRWASSPAGGWTRVEPSLTADYLMRRADQARSEGRLADARCDLLEAVGTLRQQGGKAELAQALKNLGELERRLPDGGSARQHYEEAVALFRELGEPLKLAHTVRHLGDVHRDAGRAVLAEPCYHEALALYRSHKRAPPLDLANAIRSLAVLKEDDGQIEEAARLWQEAHDIYAALDVPAGVAESAARLARLARATP